MNLFSLFSRNKRPPQVRVPPGQGMQTFTNKTGRPLEVYVEMYSDLYILQPDDVMTLLYDDDLSASERGLFTEVHGDSLLIYPTTSDTASVLINGKPVDPWDQSVVTETKV